MRHLIFCSFLVFITLLFSCDYLGQRGVCETSEVVKFRNLAFTFPLSGTKVAELASGKFEYIAAWIKTDSLLNSEQIYWYFDYSTNRNDIKDTAANLRDCAIYGVTLKLYNEEQKTESDIILELKKNYPGNYIFYQGNGHPYWLYDKGCLKILVQKRYYDINSETSTKIPVISFCYGVSDSQIKNYAADLGNLVNTH